MKQCLLGSLQRRCSRWVRSTRLGTLFYENWKLRKAQDPSLALSWQNEGSPYTRSKPLYNEDGTLNGNQLLIFAAGVTNTGGSTDDVSVKLMRMQPPEHSERWGMALRVMDSESDQKFAARSVIHQSPNTPLVYYELLTQAITSEGALK